MVFSTIKLRLLFFVGLIFILVVSPSQEIFADHATAREISQTFDQYLPLLARSDSFPQDVPIWAHADLPAMHEVSLFRHTFLLEEDLESVELRIFADTRYEVWLDGVSVGRGPARFSRTLREYDVYDIGPLSAGQHLIAALVQWAPNNKRSESVAPYLQAHLLGRSTNGAQTRISTGQDWKSLLSDAWRSDAVPIHAWGLIGPTELLDLSRLPQAWNQPGFNDSHWDPAIVQDTSVLHVQANQLPQNEFIGEISQATINFENPVRRLDGDSARVRYQPRSIPPLDYISMPMTVIDGGLISPGFKIGELRDLASDPYTVNFSAAEPAAFTVETLYESIISGSHLIQLDGKSLNLQAAGDSRPDVHSTTINIESGPHNLSFSGLPSQGITFAVSASGVEFSDFPFQQGNHAGRRMLLANPASDLDQIDVSSTDELTVQFNNLPAYIILDLGRTVHGRLHIDVTGPQGTVLDIGWDERLLNDTKRPLPYPGSLHPLWNQVDSWILDGRTRSLSTLDARAGRYVLIAVWGSGPVRLGNIRVYEERFPAIQNGDFQSSDPLLNQIWQTGVDSIYPNMTDAYTDTPWRERGQWWGDAYVIDHVNRVAFGDTALLRRGILFMADAFANDLAPGAAPNSNSTNMLDYAMLWVHSLTEYYRQTRDISFVIEMYPVVKQFLDQLTGYKSQDTGLLDLPEAHWSQTAYIGTLGYHSRYGQSTALNSLYYSTLLEAAYAAELVGYSDDANHLQQEAVFVKQKVNTLLYLPDEHRYLTNISQDGPYPPTPQAQAWALAYGIVPDSEVDQVASSLLEMLSPDPSSPNVSIYGMFWVLEALGRSGREAEALDIIRAYYGDQINSGARTWWERFDANDDYTASLSHGWGGSPTWFLTKYLLGMEQLGPGLWTIKPALIGVPQVSGKIPLRVGELQAYWEVVNNNSKVEITASDGTEGEIIIPYNDSTLTLTLNGQLIWIDGEALVEYVYGIPGEVHIVIPGGRYNLVIYRDPDSLMRYSYFPLVHNGPVF